MNIKTFEEKELNILRNAVDTIEKKTGYTLINNPSIKTIIEMVDNFKVIAQMFPINAY